MTRKISELPMIKPDKIEKTSDLNLFFVRRVGNYTESASDAWVTMHAFINEQNLDRSRLRYFGVAHDDPRVTSEDKLRYDACILAPKNLKEKGEIGRQILKGGKYAVFTYHGSSDGLEETFDRIFRKWLPDSKENFDDTRPVFEEYFDMELANTDKSNLITKICIPIS